MMMICSTRYGKAFRNICKLISYEWFRGLVRPSDSTFNQRGDQYLAFYPPRFRQACSSHHQIVICICFWFKLKQNINKYLLLAEDPQEVLEPAYTRKDLIRAPDAHGSSGRLDPSLNKYWEGNAMAGRSAGEVWMRMGLVCSWPRCTGMCTCTVR